MGSLSSWWPQHNHPFVASIVGLSFIKITTLVGSGCSMVSWESVPQVGNYQWLAHSARSSIMKQALFAQLWCSYLQDARPQTVLVENPKTLDEKGKLVSLSQTLYDHSSLVFPRCQVTKWTMNNQSDLTVLFLLICSRWAMSPLVSPHGKDDQELLVIVPGVAYKLNPSWTCITTIIIIVNNS